MKAGTPSLGDGTLTSYPCDLCGRADGEEYLYSKVGTLTGHPFRVVRCRACGLMYLNPRLTPDAIAALYDRAYYGGDGFDRHVNYLLDFHKPDDREKTFQPEHTLRLVERLVQRPASLLDYGCGLGDLVRQAARHGFVAAGFEVSQFGADYARSQGLRVYGSPDEIPSDAFDVVTAIEVLEHCSSPMAALQTIYGCLKSGGLFYYTTENFDGFYVKRRLGIRHALGVAAQDGYIVPEGHIHFFTTRTITRYLKQVGFRTVVPFESPFYAKTGLLYRTLAKIHLAPREPDEPRRWFEKATYYGGRHLLSLLRIRRRALPLARK